MIRTHVHWRQSAALRQRNLRHGAAIAAPTQHQLNSVNHQDFANNEHRQYSHGRSRRPARSRQTTHAAHTEKSATERPDRQRSR